MCVTVAIKLPRDRDTGEPVKDAKWTLFKIRDRAYEPTYQFKTYNTGKTTSLHLVDEESDWTECIRVNNKTGDTELMFVNSALNNAVDLKDGANEERKPKKPGNAEVLTTTHGLIARRIARTADLEEAVKAFGEMKFDGCTFISDGEKCFLIETSAPDAKKSEETKKKERETGQAIRTKEHLDKYELETKEVTDWLCVRTNHGILNKRFGYQKEDGIPYKSSSKRREFAEAYIRENVFHVGDIIPAIDAMGDQVVHKNPFLRPRRIQSEIIDWIKNGGEATEIFSTSAVIMTAAGNMHVKLYDAYISKVNIQKLYDKDFPIKVSIIR